ncbi:hypothetical protein SAMN05216375_11949 [Trichococcus ilyis]|uniref:Uncharacterized protein n=2 Tax=Trichococcus ilyis TaxID=640938 RepID=A0A143Y8Z4_9LACT|nr:Hypothetical protein TR210_401 [Trichococcus ilyis]SEJ61804.1 hypothetical protein SAMN05216375_11949 [Trichococcus ilyis]
MKHSANKQSNKNRKRMKEKEIVEYGSDENFFFIVDYTPGGTPYGITWEQAAEDGLLDSEETNEPDQDFPF